MESVQAAERGDEENHGAPAEWSAFDGEPRMASHTAGSWQAAFIEQQVSLCLSLGHALLLQGFVAPE